VAALPSGPIQNEAVHLAHLRTLEALLAGQGYTTQLLEKSARIPYHILVTRLPQPGAQPPLELALSFYPVDAGEVKHSLLLQYYSELPLALDAAGLRLVRELLPALNGKTVLGHFGVVEGRHALNYRYVQALLADAPITYPAIADVLLLVGYTPALFLELLDSVARGRILPDEARAQLAARDAQPGASG
jgi:hypothetical protein